MARSVYIASAEGETGKGAVALGVLDLLTRRVGHVGVFRPIVRTGDRPDYVLELLLDHDGVELPYDLCAGVTYDDVHNDPDGAMSAIVERYHEAARDCAAMVVVGSDHTDVGSPTEQAVTEAIARARKRREPKAIKPRHDQIPLLPATPTA